MTTDRRPETEDRPPSTLLELVRHYSPSGQESEAVEYLIRRMEELGFGEAYRDEAGNAVGVMGDGPRQLILLGHIDTVPGKIPVRISPPPGEEGEKMLHGRGTVDAKGPLAAFVDAVAAVGPVEGWQLVVIGAVDEERHSAGARHIVNQAQYQPDFAIIGEPSRWNRITLGYKGSARAKISVQRAKEHAAAQNPSASEVAVEVWNRIRGWAEEGNQGKKRVFEQVSPSLRGFSSTRDDFEERAILEIGVRLPLALDPSEWYEQLHTLAAPENVEKTGFPIPAYKAQRNTPLVRAFLGAIRAEGQRPGFVVKTGTADLNIVAPVWGCPAVAYGPGDSSLDHTPKEHISLAEYQKAVHVLVRVIKTLTERVRSCESGS